MLAVCVVDTITTAGVTCSNMGASDVRSESGAAKAVVAAMPLKEVNKTKLNTSFFMSRPH